MRTLKLSALSALIACLAFAEGATSVTKEATGEAAVINKDEAKAIEEARQQALRAAVEQAAGVRLSADTVTVNNQLVRDQILTNTSGYIKSSEVVSKKVEKGVASVTVKAVIITENLDKDLEAAKQLVKRMGRPSVVISIQEQTASQTSAVMTTDTMSKFLAEALEKDGWIVKDPAALDKDFKLGASISTGDAQVVRNIGALTKANFVVYGNAAFRNQDPGPIGFERKQQGDKTVDNQIMFPVTGEYGLNVFSTDDGTQIGRIAGTMKSPDPAWAKNNSLMSYERTTFSLLSHYKEKFVGDLRKTLIEHLRNKQANGTEISLSVSGLPSMGAVKEFSQAISTIKGVKDTQFLNDFKKGTASFRVTYSGEPKDLAEQVEAATFKKKKLEVVGVTSNTMEVSIAK